MKTMHMDCKFSDIEHKPCAEMNSFATFTQLPNGEQTGSRQCLCLGWQASGHSYEPKTNYYVSGCQRNSESSKCVKYHKTEFLLLHFTFIAMPLQTHDRYRRV